MPSFKLKGAKAQEAKSGFEPYDGPIPSRNGFYRAVIKVMKWGANSSGSSGFNITAELQAAPGDPKNHAQYDGYPMFSRSIITESADGGALKEGAQRNLDNLLAALGTKDEPDVVLADDDGDKVDVKKIGGRNPIGAIVNIDLQMKMYEGERRPEVGGIYKYKEIDAPAGKSTTVVTEDDEDDEADLMESDEAEEAEGDDEIAARQAELEAMGVAALRNLAKELEVQSSGAKAAVIERILDAEYPAEGDDEDADEADEDEPEDAEEDEAEDDEAEDDEAEEDDEDEEADEEDDEEREARVAELADMNRVALKAVLKEIAPDFTVLKRHSDDDLRTQIIGVEFAEDLPF